MCEEGQELRNADPVLNLAVRVPTEDVEGGAARGRAHALHRGQLDGLMLRDGAPRPVTHEYLNRRGERRDRQWYRQRGALVATEAPAQPRHRICAGHEEARDD